MRRMPLRLRFACLTALSVVLGGFAVLSLNYLLLQDRFGPAIERVPLTDARPPDGPGAVEPRDAGGAGSEGGEDAVTVPAPETEPGGDGQTRVVPPPEGAQSEPPASSQVVVLQERFEQAALRTVLVQSVIALAVTAVAALAVAWLVAGRYLTPIRGLADTVHGLSEATLHRRIRHDGPRDEIHELADSFDRMLDRLEQAFAAQRRFIANASHELRTPLTVTRTAMEVLAAKQEPSAEQVRAATATVVAASERSERAIAGLLALARADQGVDRRERLRLDAVVREALEARTSAASARAVTLDVTLAPVSVVGDPDLLETLVGNVLDNAVKYNVDGGRIEVVADVTERDVRLRVSNTGDRLPPGAEDWIFEPFRRAHGDRQSGRDGSGLGLAIVRAIATAHGGGATAAGRPDGGLTVVVTLPLSPA